MKYQSEREFAQFVNKLGGVLWQVGGAVRDEVMGRAPHDKDYMITGVPIASLPFDRIAGRDFPVFRVEVGSNTCEIALARREM